MKIINFDSELVLYIQGLYGDADLDNKTLKLLHTLWQTNPLIIKNAYQLKVNTTPVVNLNNSLIKSKFTDTIPQRISKPEIADDDLSGISNFNDAFKVASLKDLLQFKWKSTKANPSGLFAVKFKTSDENQLKPNDKLIELKSNNELVENSDKDNIPNKRRKALSLEFVNKMVSLGMKWNPSTKMWTKLNKNVQEVLKPQIDLNDLKNKSNVSKLISVNPSDNLQIRQVNPPYRLLGFIDFANPVVEPKVNSPYTDSLLRQNYYINRWDNYYPNFMDYYKHGGQLNNIEEMEKSIFAKMGAKLDYISLLNGRCPEGYEVEKFLKGGCVKCCKKAMETNIFENKCGGKAKKRISKNK